MARTRVGFRIGRSSWISFGRSGPRVGGRIGPVRISTGRSGTRVGAGKNGVFVSQWHPAPRATSRPASRTPRPTPRPTPRQVTRPTPAPRKPGAWGWSEWSGLSVLVFLVVVTLVSHR